MKAILYLILIIFAYLIIKSLLEPRRGSSGKKIRSRAADAGSEMVRDLYCNTFVPKESAIKEVVSGKAYYFCSKECFNKFRAKTYQVRP